MSSNCCGADRFFDLKVAKKELRKYKKSGAGKPTQALIDAMGSSELKDRTLLDIGGGIGAIQWDFLKKGGTKTTHLDYSEGYLEVAEKYAKENNLNGQIAFIQGDFLEEADAIGNHDFVTLDKVICCYPDYKRLLTKALSKCDQTIGIVYPIGGMVAKVVVFFASVYLKLTGNSFHPYIHPVISIRQVVLDQDFESVHSSVCFPWHVEVYRRI